MFGVGWEQVAWLLPNILRPIQVIGFFPSVDDAISLEPFNTIFLPPSRFHWTEPGTSLLQDDDHRPDRRHRNQFNSRVQQSSLELKHKAGIRTSPSISSADHTSSTCLAEPVVVRMMRWQVQSTANVH